MLNVFDAFSNSNNLERKHLILILTIIVFIGFAIRYFPFQHKLSLDDTYFQYSIITHILESGHAPQRLPLANYPDGRSLLKAPLLLPYFIAYSYKLLQPFGVSLTEYMIVIPALLGSLAALPLYFLVERLFNKRIAILSAFIYVLIPASVDRTFAGFVEKEGLASFLFFIWLYYFIISIEHVDIERKSLLYSVFAGIFMGASFYTWEGATYFALLISITLFITSVFQPNMRYSISIFIMTAIGFSAIWILNFASYQISELLFRIEFITLIFVSIFSFAADTNVFKKYRKKVKTPHLVGISVLFLFILILFNTVNDGAIRMPLDFAQFPGVTEAQRFSLEEQTLSTNPFSWLVLFVPLGVYFYLKKSKEYPVLYRVLIWAWFISASFSSYNQARFFFILAPVAAMFISLGFFESAGYHLNQLKHSGKIDSEKIDLKNKDSKEKYRAYLAILLLSFCIFGTVKAEVSFAGDLKSYQLDRINSWEKAMEYLVNNTPEDSLVIAWWDYGYVIQGLGRRATIADPGGGLSKRRIDVAKILTSPEDGAIKIITKYNSGNKPVYVIVSWEEFLLSESINQMADDNLYFLNHVISRSGNDREDQKKIMEFIEENSIEAFALERTQDHWRIWFTGFIPLQGGEYEADSDMKNKLLPKLLNFNTGMGKGLEHFNLVYRDEKNFVFIYEVN